MPTQTFGKNKVIQWMLPGRHDTCHTASKRGSADTVDPCCIVTQQEIYMKKIVWLPIVLAFAAFTAGCNTMEGAGEDIERGGEKIQQQAR